MDGDSGELEVGLAEVVSQAEQREARDFGGRIAHTVTQVELGGMPTLAEAPERLRRFTPVVVHEWQGIDIERPQEAGQDLLGIGRIGLSQAVIQNDGSLNQ